MELEFPVLQGGPDHKKSMSFDVSRRAQQVPCWWSLQKSLINMNYDPFPTEIWLLGISYGRSGFNPKLDFFGGFVDFRTFLIDVCSIFRHFRRSSHFLRTSNITKSSSAPRTAFACDVDTPSPPQPPLEDEDPMIAVHGSDDDDDAGSRRRRQLFFNASSEEDESDDEEFADSSDEARPQPTLLDHWSQSFYQYEGDHESTTITSHF
jgi:hypothetical protein